MISFIIFSKFKFFHPITMIYYNIKSIKMDKKEILIKRVYSVSIKVSVDKTMGEGYDIDISKTFCYNYRKVEIL